MYRTDFRVSGFKVTYKRPNANFFFGWPEYLEHTFGTDQLTGNYTWEYLQKDLEQITLCVDTSNKSELKRDFRGFELKQYGEYNINLIVECKNADKETFDLAQKRVIGFSVITSEYDD